MEPTQQLKKFISQDTSVDVDRGVSVITTTKSKQRKSRGYFGGEGSEAGDGLGHGGDSELEEVETCSDLVPGVIDDAGRRRDGDDSSSLRRRGEDPGPRPLPGHHPPWDSSGRPSVPTAKVVVVVG
mmetsp:Transcript_3802/g.9757  ORF Transcript_3802/g.9757 Transcript_3802/m.9757 type:complete len:126 (-) Transcript_3802:56-433(-)